MQHPVAEDQEPSDGPEAGPQVSLGPSGKGNVLALLQLAATG